MVTLRQAVVDLEEKILQEGVTQRANAKLQHLMIRYGLGVAVLAAGYHGLEHGHILTMLGNLTAEEAQPRVLPADADCPYVFAHVPIRTFRGNRAELVKAGVMNARADVTSFVYHEDGLVSVLSFPEPRPLSLRDDAEIREILEALAQQGVLTRANVNNRQIQFKDSCARERLERSREKVYVVRRMPDRLRDRLPHGLDGEEEWAYLKNSLALRRECNFCSVQALNPREVTLHSTTLDADRELGDLVMERLATVRNYQFGFTFAPFGDPEEVFHFLAWDFPHIGDLVMDMEPQVYSFSDLIKIVRIINDDIDRFARHKGVPPPAPVTGACNHWAGNSIYHQHYQFFRLPRLPLLLAGTEPEPIAESDGVRVWRVADPWPNRSYVITSPSGTSDDAVLEVADRVAQEWQMLSNGEDHSYGNGIVIQNYTQNILVTIEDGKVIAVFVPRERRRVSTTRTVNRIQKRNAGVLEMAGYFVIDSREDFEILQAMPSADRTALADSWLEELAPDKADLDEFEKHVRISLGPIVRGREETIPGPRYRLRMSSTSSKVRP